MAPGPEHIAARSGNQGVFFVSLRFVVGEGENPPFGRGNRIRGCQADGCASKVGYFRDLFPRDRDI